ncbi:MAG: tape measure protein [Marinilabiliaceae bacterium]|nr:tape measure protein [Marinilabiliaceae bacterium]
MAELFVNVIPEIAGLRKMMKEIESLEKIKLQITDPKELEKINEEVNILNRKFNEMTASTLQLGGAFDKVGGRLKEIAELAATAQKTYQSQSTADVNAQIDQIAALRRQYEMLIQAAEKSKSAIEASKVSRGSAHVQPMGASRTDDMLLGLRDNYGQIEVLKKKIVSFDAVKNSNLDLDTWKFQLLELEKQASATENRLGITAENFAEKYNAALQLATQKTKDYRQQISELQKEEQQLMAVRSDLKTKQDELYNTKDEANFTKEDWNIFDEAKKNSDAIMANKEALAEAKQKMIEATLEVGQLKAAYSGLSEGINRNSEAPSIENIEPSLLALRAAYEKQAELQREIMSYNPLEDNKADLTAKEEELAQVTTNVEELENKLGLTADTLNSKYNAAIKEAQTNTQKFSSEVGSLKKQREELNKQLDEAVKERDEAVKLGKAHDELDDKIKQTTISLNENSNALAKANLSMIDSQMETKRLEASYKDLHAGINRNLNQEEPTNTISENLENAGNSIVGTLGKVTAVVAGFSGFRSLIGNIENTRKQFQLWDAQLTSLVGEDKAGQLQQQLFELAKQSPLEMSDMVQAETMMLSFGISANDTVKYISALGDISMGNSQKFNSLALAFSQMSSAGRLMGQDLMQMVNAGFNPLEQMSRTTGKSIATLKEEMQKGLITASQVQQAFLDATGAEGKFFEMSNATADTIGGQAAKVQDAIAQMYNEMGTYLDGFFEGKTEAITWAIEHWKEFAVVIGSATATLGVAKTAMIAVQVAQALNNKQTGIGLLLEKARSKSLGSVVTSMFTMNKATLAATIGQHGYNAALLACPYVLAAAAVAALALGIYKLATSSSAAKQAQDNLSKSMAEADGEAQKEISLIDKLDTKMATLDKTTDAYAKTREQLVDIASQYNSEIAEEIKKNGLTEESYANLTAAIQKHYRIKAYLRWQDSENARKQEIINAQIQNINEDIQSEYINEGKTADEKRKRAKEAAVAMAEITRKIYDGSELKTDRKGNSWRFTEETKKSFSEATQNFLDNYFEENSTIVFDNIEEYIGSLSHEISGLTNEMNSELNLARYGLTQDDLEAERTRQKIEAEREAEEEAEKKRQQEEEARNKADKKNAKEREKEAEKRNKAAKQLAESKNAYAEMFQKQGEEERKRIREENFKTRQYEIDLEKDAVTKANLQRQLDFDKEMAQLEDQKKQRIEQIISNAKATFDANEKIAAAEAKNKGDNNYLTKQFNREAYIAEQLAKGDQGDFAVAEKEYQENVFYTKHKQENEERTEQKKLLKQQEEYWSGYLSIVQDYASKINDYQNSLATGDLTKSQYDTYRKLAEQDYTQALKNGGYDESINDGMAMELQTLASMLVQNAGNSLFDLLNAKIAEVQMLADAESEDEDSLDRIAKLNAEIAALRERIKQLQEEGKLKLGSGGLIEDWRRYGNTIAKVTGRVYDLADAFGAGDQIWVNALADITDGTMIIMDSLVELKDLSKTGIQDIQNLAETSVEGMESAAEAGSRAMQAVERASVILAIIGAALKIINALSDVFGGDKERDSYNKAVEKQKEINKMTAAVDDYTRAVREAKLAEKNWFSTSNFTGIRDQWQLAQDASEAYFKKVNEQQVQYQDRQAGRTGFGKMTENLIKGALGDVNAMVELGKQTWNPITGTKNVYSGSTAKYKTNTVDAIDNLRFETRAREHGTWFRSGHAQETTDLRSWAKEHYGADLINEETGMIDVDMATNILENFEDKLVGETKETLEKLRDEAKAYQEAIENIKNAVADMYSPLVDDMTNAVWTWLETGEDALSTFEESAGATFANIAKEMIKTMANKRIFSDMSEELETLANSYAKGEIDEEEMMKKSVDLVDRTMASAEAEIKTIEAVAKSMTDYAEQKGYDIMGEKEQEATFGGYETMSEQTGTELSGRFSAMYLVQSEQLGIAKETMTSINKWMPLIAASLQDHPDFIHETTDLMANSLVELRQISANTDTMKKLTAVISERTEQWHNHILNL